MSRPGAFFADLPGCTLAGATAAEAASNAEEVLAGHLLVSEEYGDELAAPSELHAVEVDPDVDEVVRVLVRGRELEGLNSITKCYSYSLSEGKPMIERGPS